MQDSFSEPTQEKVALHLFPGENCTLTPLPGVARVVHSKAFCTVHWQEGGRCKQSAKDTHTLPPAQILGIQSGQGTARGQLKCPRAISEAKAGGRPPPSTDASQSSGESSPESAPGEGAAASFSSPDASDRLPPGLQDAGGRLEKTPAVAAAEGGDGPAREPGAPACACGQLPDLEDELSLLDPFPRYMKSCQDLIIPEQGRHVDPRPAAWPSPEARSAEGADLARTRAPSPVRGPPGPEPQSSPGFQPDVCTKDLLDTPAEEPQEKVSPSDPPPQGQPAAKPPKDVPASRLAQQLREEGWNLQTSESLTLAEVYLMMGKPSKLQLEYDWLAVLGPEASGPHAGPQPATFHKQRLLSCLLKLISTEVNPRLVSGVQRGGIGLGAGGRAQGLPEELVWGWPVVPWSRVGCTRALCPVVQAFVLSRGAHTGCTVPGCGEAAVPERVGHGDEPWMGTGAAWHGAGNRAGFSVLGKGLPGGTVGAQPGSREQSWVGAALGGVWPEDLVGSSLGGSWLEWSGVPRQAPG